MDEILAITKDYPRFTDGRIDYTNERICPVVNCTVVCGGDVLLTYRSKDVVTYTETWNGISGFIDEPKALEEIIRDELSEEVGINAPDVKAITIRPKKIQVDEEINREWYVFPALVELKRKPTLTANWEIKLPSGYPKLLVSSTSYRFMLKHLK